MVGSLRKAWNHRGAFAVITELIGPARLSGFSDRLRKQPLRAAARGRPTPSARSSAGWLSYWVREWRNW